MTLLDGERDCPPRYHTVHDSDGTIQWILSRKKHVFVDGAIDAPTPKARDIEDTVSNEQLFVDGAKPKRTGH